MTEIEQLAGAVHKIHAMVQAQQQMLALAIGNLPQGPNVLRDFKEASIKEADLRMLLPFEDKHLEVFEQARNILMSEVATAIMAKRPNA